MHDAIGPVRGQAFDVEEVTRRAGVMPTPRILAAIVTYNRSALLERCVESVLAQTRPPDLLLVVNNSSTDDTEQMLDRRGVAYITQPNRGGAGGFNRAIQYALDEGYDHVWLMDDDGYADAAALGILIKEMKPGIACASSAVLREETPARFVFPFPSLNRRGMPSIVGWPRRVRTLKALEARRPDRIYPFAQLFNGVLVSLDAVRRAGNIETAFVMFGDEVDFLMRLRQVGETLTHLDAHHFHPDVTKRPIGDAKTYYYIKNTIILNFRYFNLPRLRSVLTVAAALARAFSRNGFRPGVSLMFGRKSPLLRKAIVRGLRGQVGQDLDS